MKYALATLLWLAPLVAHADPESSAAELFALSVTRAFGWNGTEIWKSEWNGQELDFGVARRFQNGKVDVVVRVFQPHKYDPLAFLIRPRSNGAPMIEYFRSPKLFAVGARTGRTLEVELASPIERLPFAPGLPALVDLYPPRAADVQLARLGDREVSGIPCRVLEQRLRHRDGAYDRVVTYLSRDSNLALSTEYLRGEQLVRRVTVVPTDIDRSTDQPIVRKRSVDRPGEKTQVLTMERFSLDPVLPDQLFTTSNLRTGRFPSY